MIPNISKGKEVAWEDADPAPGPGNCVVYLIGPVKLQNSVLNLMIRDELGIPNFCIDELDLSRLNRVSKSNRRILVLVDGNGRALSKLVADTVPIERLAANCSVVFFNVRASARNELHREIAARGITRIFFEDASLESLLKEIVEFSGGIPDLAL